MSAKSSPVLKQGWLKKQSRSGLIKKWQTRYFVINAGVIYYYQEKIDTFPFGEIQKGDLPLRGASISNGDKKYTDKQIYIIAANSKEDNNMLIEAESIDVANDWKRSITEHIKFSEAMGLSGTPVFGRSSTGGSIDGINSSFRSTSTEGVGGPLSLNSRTTETAAAGGGRSSLHGGGDGIAAAAAGDGGAPSPAVWGTPRPGWVVKVLRSNGEKIFINVCEHEDVFFQPVTVGFNKWPNLVMAPGRTVSEGDGGGGKEKEVMVYDAVVHPNVIALCNKEATHKDAVCLRVLRLLKKNFHEQVDSDYKLPKISKRFKGEPQSVLLLPEGQNNTNSKKGLFGGLKRSKSNQTTAPVGSGVVVEGQSEEEKAAASALACVGDANSARTKTNKPFSIVAAPHVTNGRVDKVGDGDSMARNNSIFQRSLSYQPPDNSSNNGSNNNINNYNSNNNSSNNNNNNRIQGGGGGGSSLHGMFPGVVDDHNSASNRLTNNNLDRGSQFARTNTFTPEVSSTSGGQQPTAAYSRWNAVAKRASLNPKVAAANGFANTVGGMENLGDKRSLSSSGATASKSGLHEPLLNQKQGSRSLSESAGMATVFRRFIPYNIVRNNGTIVKQAPDKSAPGKVLKQGSKVLVLARKVMADGLAWLKTTEGWIVEKNYAGSVARALAPAQHGQPVGAKIVSTRFEDCSDAAAAGRESMVKKVSMKDDGSGTRITTDQSEYTMRPSNSGWTVFGASSKVTSYQTRFTIDIIYAENAVIRISRTYAEVSSLRDSLLNFPDRMIKDRTLKAGEFPVIEDGNDEMVEDVNELLYVVESVENWLSKVLPTITVDRCKCKALLDFLTPKDIDIYMMEKELMADGGLCGSHGGVD